MMGAAFVRSKPPFSSRTASSTWRKMTYPRKSTLLQRGTFLTLHSRLRGYSSIRGGFTLFDGLSVKLASEHLSTSLLDTSPHYSTSLSIQARGMLTTNSPLSSMSLLEC